MKCGRVLVMGGAPVGMVAAAALGSHGISVLPIDKTVDPTEVLHASTFHPPTPDDLARTGIVDDLAP